MESEGWIKHDGGPCPVDGAETVEIMFADRGGMASKVLLCARTWDWSHKGDAADVIAYRLAEPQAHMMSAPEVRETDWKGYAEFWRAEAEKLKLEQSGLEGELREVEACLTNQLDKDARIAELEESLREMTFFKNIWLQVAKDYARAIEGYRDGHKRSRDPVQPGNVSRANAGLLVVAPLTPLLGKGNDEEGTPSKPRPVFSWGNPV
jgi:hypothetical protein